jgi:polysaccharide biosynthesis/export protein
MNMKWLLAALLGLAWLSGSSAWSQPSGAPSATNVVSRIPLKMRQLVPQDLILVEVYQEPDLEARRRVGQDGIVTLPLLGRMAVGGKTIEEVQTLIHDGLAKDYLVNPRVTVTLIEPAKWKFTVMGEVQRQGSYEVIYGENVNLVQAIGMAGGATPKGNLKKVKIMRTDGQTTQPLDVDVAAMMQDPNARILEVRPDDIIKVPERIF